MIDIETLGTSHDAVIVQIGACWFDRNTGEIKEDPFIVNISIEDCRDCCLRMDAGAITFWARQGGATWGDRPVDLDVALIALKGWVETTSTTKKFSVWAHATFDFPILANAHKAVEIDMPWSRRQCRDIRTLVDLSGIKKPKTEEKSHDALDDCRYQVKYCYECFKQLSKLTG